MWPSGSTPSSKSRPAVPGKRLGSRSINKDQLAKLRDSGVDSEVLLARLDFVEMEGMRKDLVKLSKTDRVFPEILPTQASGRWSTKNPNLGGFKREFWKKHRSIIHPDPGEWWLEWDWSAIEGRLFTAYSGDEEDVALYTLGKDIHTFTCAKYLMQWAPMLSVNSPLSGYNLPSDWHGKDDERRVRAKNFRYGPYQYGTGARAILGMPGIESLHLDRGILVSQAQAFLDARPKGVAWKAMTWVRCQTDKEARTFMGRRRKLVGPAEDMAKDGLNHTIQGSVADLMDWCLIQVEQQWPQGHLILNKHDGAILAFPDSCPVEPTQAAVRLIVEREWEIGQGIKMTFPATWCIVDSDGTSTEDI